MHLRKVGFRLIGLAILGLLLLRLDLGFTLKMLADVRLGDVFSALTMLPILFGLKTWRWQKLLRMQGITYRFRDSFLAFMAGIFLGLITPGRLGEMGKALYLRQDMGVPISEGLASVLMDRVFDLYTILVVGFAGLIWFRLLPPWTLAVIMVCMLGALLLPFALLSERLANYGLSIIAVLPFTGKAVSWSREAIARFQDALRPLLTPGLMIPFVLTLAAYALFFGQVKVLAVALGLKIGMPYLAVSLSVAGVITLLPISFAGLGTRDAVLIALLSPLGPSPEQTVAFSTLFFLVSYVGAGLIGALAWQLKPLRQKV